MVSILSCIFLSPLLITFPPSVNSVLPKGCSTPLAELQQPKDISSFSSSTSSPWDSPEAPFQVLTPALSRAQSAPITQPSEPIDPIRSPAAVGLPESVDGFSSQSWSQNQWIAFGDSTSCRRGPFVMELQRFRAGACRSSRFLSDDSADTYNREDSSLCVSDVFCDRAPAAAPSSKIHNGNKKNGFRDVFAQYLEFFFKFFL